MRSTTVIIQPCGFDCIDGLLVTALLGSLLAMFLL
jgi:hypothetical protein